MKTLTIGFVSLALGVGGGAYVGGTRVKEVILAERAQAHTDSLAAAAVVEGPGLGVTPDHVEGGVAVALGTEPHVDPLDPGDTPPDSGDPGEPENTGNTGGTQETDPSGEPDAVAPAEPATVSDTQVNVSAQPAPPAQPDSAAIQGAIKLAQIFSAMKPVDAAAVLQEMTDVEVEAILQHMQSRLAGQVLGEFDPERAALLSRVVLGGASGS